MRKIFFPTLFSLLFLVSCYQSTTNVNTSGPQIDPIDSRGCLGKYSENFSAQAYIENGTCKFTYCDNPAYANYSQDKLDSINEYIKIHGAKLANGNSRTNVVCRGEKIYCSHPDSLNYVPDTEERNNYGKEYCYFTACDDADFFGYQKLLEYREFLQENDGEIKINNNQRYCLDRRYFHEKNSLTPDVISAKYEEADISFILDDSGSMKDEIDAVKEALINLAPTFKNLNKKINLSFHRMSDIEKESRLGPENSYSLNKKLDNDKYLFSYSLPKSFGNLVIDKTKGTDLVRTEIETVLGDFKIKNGFGNEQGLCLTLKHLNDYKNKTYRKKTQSVSIVISDEDEHFKNNSNNCLQTFESEDEKIVKNPKNKTAYKDNQGNKYHIESFIDLFETLNQEQKDAYGWIGIFYDKKVSSCGFANSSASTYINFAEQLNAYNIKNFTGDICSNNYSKLINDKLIEGFLEKIELRYLILTNSKAPVINKLQVQDANNNLVDINSTQYSLISDGTEHFIEFDNTLSSLIRTSKSIKVDLTYEK